MIIEINNTKKDRKEIICYLGYGCHAHQWSTKWLEHVRLCLRRKPRAFDDDDGTTVVEVRALLLCHVNKYLQHRQHRSGQVNQAITDAGSNEDNDTRLDYCN